MLAFRVFVCGTRAPLGAQTGHIDRTRYFYPVAVDWVAAMTTATAHEPRASVLYLRRRNMSLRTSVQGMMF